MPSRRELTRKLTPQRPKRHQPLQLPNQFLNLNKIANFCQYKKMDKKWKARPAINQLKKLKQLPN